MEFAMRTSIKKRSVEVEAPGLVETCSRIPLEPQHLHDPVGGGLGANAGLSISTPDDAQGRYPWGSSDPGNLDGHPLLGGKRLARFLPADLSGDGRREWRRLACWK